MMTFLLLFLLVATAGYGLYVYNRLVRLFNYTKEAWSGIDVQLKKRHELIPLLVKTVKEYAAHERNLLETITDLRSRGIAAGSLKDAETAEVSLSKALGNLFVVVENYPELKANQNFLALQEELTSTENKIGFARQHYNNVVEGYNTAIQVFPAVVFAGMLGFEREPFFEIEEPGQREAPKVKF